MEPHAHADKQNPWLIPASILIAGVLIAGSLYLSRNAPSADSMVVDEAPLEAENLDAIDPVTASDHMRGNPNAPVTIVEYSDFECPFCKRFHDTMTQVMNEYGDDGKVKWVFRHFPLDVLHAKARPVAIASECVAAQAGEEGFWKFADRYNELTLSNDQTDLDTVLPQIAQEIGVDTKVFSACLTSGAHDAKILANETDAAETGGSGTPWNIVIGPDGKKYSVNGAQPYAVVKRIIDQALQD